MTHRTVRQTGVAGGLMTGQGAGESSRRDGESADLMLSAVAELAMADGCLPCGHYAVERLLGVAAAIGAHVGGLVISC